MEYVTGRWCRSVSRQNSCFGGRCSLVRALLLGLVWVATRNAVIILQHITKLLFCCLCCAMPYRQVAGPTLSSPYHYGSAALIFITNLLHSARLCYLCSATRCRSGQLTHTALIVRLKTTPHIHLPASEGNTAAALQRQATDYPSPSLEDRQH